MIKKDYEREAISLEEYLLLKAEYANEIRMSDRIGLARKIYEIKDKLGIVSEKEKEMQEKLVKLVEEHESYKGRREPRYAQRDYYYNSFILAEICL